MSKSLKVNPAEITIPANYPRSRQPEEKDVQHLIEVAAPPIVTACKGTVLVDGAHRRLAAILEGKSTVEVEDLGNLDEQTILIESVRRNATHGKQLTPAEKQRSATALFTTMKVKELAEMLGVSERTVSRWIGEAKDAEKAKAKATAEKLIKKGVSVAGAAREVGVSRSTLQGWLNEEPKAEKPKAEPKPKAKKDEGFDANSLGQSDEVRAAVDIMVNSIVSDSKAALEESNPEGLHLYDFLQLVIDGLEAYIHKS